MCVAVCVRLCSSCVRWRGWARTPRQPVGNSSSAFLRGAPWERRDSQCGPRREPPWSPTGRAATLAQAGRKSRPRCLPMAPRPDGKSGAQSRGEGNRGEPHAPAKPDSNHRDAARAPRAPRRHAAAEVQSMCSPRPPVGRRCISLRPPLRAAAPHSLGEPTRPARRKRRKGGASTTITYP